MLSIFSVSLCNRQIPFARVQRLLGFSVCKDYLGPCHKAGAQAPEILTVCVWHLMVASSGVLMQGAPEAHFEMLH